MKNCKRLIHSFEEQDPIGDKINLSYLMVLTSHLKYDGRLPHKPCPPTLKLLTCSGDPISAPPEAMPVRGEWGCNTLGCSACGGVGPMGNFLYIYVALLPSGLLLLPVGAYMFALYLFIIRCC